MDLCTPTSVKVVSGSLIDAMSSIDGLFKSSCLHLYTCLAFFDINLKYKFILMHLFFTHSLFTFEDIHILVILKMGLTYSAGKKQCSYFDICSFDLLSNWYIIF